MDEWMERLRQATDEVWPTGDARARVTAELRRRRRIRWTAYGAAGAVAALTAAGLALPALLGGDPSPGPGDRFGASGPTAGDPARFTCPTESPVLTEQPALPDGDVVNANKMAYDRITSGDFDGFEVHHIEHFLHAGVYVLVTGDLAAARRQLSALGAAGVGLWDPSGPSIGLDEAGQLEQLVQWNLQPVLHEARRATRGIDGVAALAYWDDAHAVLVQWEDPVPAEVRALEGVRRESGAQVIVRGVAHSAADVRRAQRALERWLVATDRRDDWSSAYACGDFSGLVVGMTPGSLEAADLGALQAEISEAIGMPAFVVPQAKPADLLPEH